MIHKRILNKIDEHVFRGEPLDVSILNHISSCKSCGSYFSKISMFKKGIDEIRVLSKSISKSLSITYTEKARFSLNLFLLRVRKSLVFGIILLAILVGILGYVFTTYISRDLHLEAKLDEYFVYMIMDVESVYYFDEIEKLALDEE
ncbi:MAG: hypothetical protein ACK4F9_02030 [Brevinematia bacterium]